MELSQEITLLESVASLALSDLDQIQCRYFLTHEMHGSLKDALSDYVRALREIKGKALEHGK